MIISSSFVCLSICLSSHPPIYPCICLFVTFLCVDLLKQVSQNTLEFIFRSRECILLFSKICGDIFIGIWPYISLEIHCYFEFRFLNSHDVYRGLVFYDNKLTLQPVTRKHHIGKNSFSSKRGPDSSNNERYLLLCGK